jgi:hypothetical protein
MYILNQTEHIEALRHHGRVCGSGGGYSPKVRRTSKPSTSGLADSGKKTELSTGFNAHSISTADGTTINVLENGEINICEAGGKRVKIRPSNTIQSTHIK